MSSNLLELIHENFTDDVVSKLADFLGESPKNTTSALSSAIPSLIAGLVNKGADEQGASAILSLLSQGSHDGGILNNLISVFSGGEGTSKLLETGAMLLDSIVGYKASGVASVIADVSGIKTASSNSLLKLLMPIIFGVLGKTVKAEGITSAAGLASFLDSQRVFLKNLVPAGLVNLLGIASLDDLGKPVAATVVQTVEKKSSGIGKYLAWLLLLLLLASGWWLLKNFKQPAPTAPEVSAPKISAPVVEKLGDFFEKTLSSGFVIKASKNGIENKLIAFIEDTGRAVDKDTWFTMDGITFETDKATLTPNSNKQVTNIAEILKAFPNVKIKIGGYTDNTGDAKANLTLSAERANTVKNALIAMGIDASRLEAEGYGSEHPVASNETAEGRQQNRRIDIRVTAK